MSKYQLIPHTEDWVCRSKFVAEREPHLYPSEASVKIQEPDGSERVYGTCMRAAYLRYTGEAEPEEPDARGQFIMSIGKVIEEWLVEQWKQMGIWINNSVKFYWPQYNISGELDAVLVDPDTGEAYGVEIKTFYGYHAKKEIFGNKSVQGFPKMNQLLQALLYTYFFKDRLTHFKMVYVERGDGSRKEFNINTTEEDGKIWPVVDNNVIKMFSINDILDRYKALQQYIDNKLIPPKDFELIYPDDKVEREYQKGNVTKTNYEKWQKGRMNIGDWQCRYCNFKNYCWD